MQSCKGMYVIVKVPKRTPLNCTEEHIKSSRISITKKPYSFERYHPCEEHEFIDFIPYCKECEANTEIVSYTADELLYSAMQSARNNCTIHDDMWVVDGDTLKIISCYRMNIEQIK